MSITIELTEGQEQMLKALVRGRGMTPEAYLEGIFAGEFPFPFKKPAEALEEWERLGILPIWQDRPEDSAELVRKLRFERQRFPETELLATMKRWTAEECDELAEQGRLPERYELIEGIIVEDMRTSDLHALLVGLLLDVFAPVFGTSRVRIEGTIRLSEEAKQRNLLVPDVTITKEERRAYQENPLPKDLLLVVEVADSSLRSDLSIKAHLYADAGIVEYWVVDAIGRKVVVHREPTPQGYQSVVEFGEGESLTTLAMPSKPIAVSELLPTKTG